MKRILAIDGGGIRGLIPAVFCQAIESYVNRPICDLFDLIAGTSTGGILALGYAMPPHGMAAKSLVALYKDHGHTIFANPKWLSSWVRPKYESGPLESLLRDYFHETKVSEAAVEVMVTTYDLHLRRPRILKRWRAREDATQDCLMREAARATSAAPTYFDPATVGKRVLVDGGVMANNPSAAALAEAARLWPGEQFLLVSLGTGALSKPILGKDATKWGKAQWAVPVIDCIFDGTSKTTDYVMRHFLPGESYWRFQSQLTEAAETLDNVTQRNLVELERLGKDLIDANRDRLSHLVTRLTAPTAPLTATIDRPHDRQVVSPGACKVYGSVVGYAGQRLYLTTGKQGKFWPSSQVRPGADNRWEGAVNLGSNSPTGTIALIVANELLADYVEYYRKHSGTLGHPGIDLSAIPSKLAEVDVIVDLGKANKAQA